MYVAEGGNTRLGTTSTAISVISLIGQPRVTATVPVPPSMLQANWLLAGLSTADHGTYLLMAYDGGTTGEVIVADATKIAQGDPAGYLGVLHTANENGTIEVASSPDGHYVAATEEYGMRVTLFDLRAALASGFHQTPATQTVVPPVPVGVSFTPDGADLLVTSEQGGPTCTGGGGQEGMLTALDVAKLASGTGNPVVASQQAGCNPVRLAISPDAQSVWVTARCSDALVRFDLPRLLANDPRALRNWITVGYEPVGVGVNATTAVVADSNRDGNPNFISDISLVDIANPSQPIVVSTSPLGSGAATAFPRDVAIVPETTTVAGHVLAAVSNFNHVQVSLVFNPVG